jgi:hypothetical protein
MFNNLCTQNISLKKCLELKSVIPFKLGIKVAKKVYVLQNLNQRIISKEIKCIKTFFCSYRYETPGTLVCKIGVRACLTIIKFINMET